MAKYSKKTQEIIAGVMKEFKKGKLFSSSGDKVTERDRPDRSFLFQHHCHHHFSIDHFFVDITCQAIQDDQAQPVVRWSLIQN